MLQNSSCLNQIVALDRAIYIKPKPYWFTQADKAAASGPKLSKVSKKAAAEKLRLAEEDRLKAEREARRQDFAGIQPARPVIVSRTETEITLDLAKRGSGGSVSVF